MISSTSTPASGSVRGASVQPQRAPAARTGTSDLDGLGARHSAPALRTDPKSGIAAIKNTRPGRSTSGLAGLARTVLARINGSRFNQYFGSQDENNNIHSVIHTSQVPREGVGFKEQKFFQGLGDTRHAHYDDKSAGPETPSRQLAEQAASSPDPQVRRQCIDALRRRAEQEYLMQGMPKGAMLAAAQIANRRGLGIAVRPTSLLAHMGIESGKPVKAQEFKNKTSKEIDLWLCDELQWGDVGTVVHYDPRLGWSSKAAASAVDDGKSRLPKGTPTTEQWHEKLEYILTVRHPQLKAQLGASIGDMPSIADLEAAFFSRADEYLAEDHAYRQGELAQHTLLDGPRIRLKARPDEDMVGDLDLFVFTREIDRHDEDGQITKGSMIEWDMEDHDVRKTQIALQSSHAFQAQHGPIWYWDPSHNDDKTVAKFNSRIKNTIMAAHSPGSSDPLIYIQPGNRVSAAFYDPASKELRSVWDGPSSTGWLAKTHSGALLQGLLAERPMT